MTDIKKNLLFFFKKIVRIKRGQNLLIITDNYARPKFIGELAMELSNELGVHPIMVVMEPRAHAGDEPPKFIANAMKEVDVIFEAVEKYSISHTNARKEANEAGVKFLFTFTEISEDHFGREISFEDLKVIRKRTNTLAKMLTEASTATLTTPHGTNLTMGIKGRRGIALHPLTERISWLFPDYGEATISPKEGSTEGVVVVDGSVQGWGYLLKEPIRFNVKRGRIEKVMGRTEEVRKFKKIISMDENANNCAAEFGIGTSHTVPKNLHGGLWDYGSMGTVHIAVGRNNDIGGETWSKIHNDLLMTQPFLKLDGVRVLENGRIMV